MTLVNAEGDAEHKALFAQVQFYIVKTDDLREDYAGPVRLNTA